MSDIIYSTAHRPVKAVERALTPQQRNVEWLVATVVFILSLTLYVATMCRTVYWWDTGELAANAKVLGIAHRPGFPLYILIGRLFGMMPFGDFFYRINFFSALSGAASLALLAHLSLRLHARQSRDALRESFAAVVLASLAIAGTFTFWMQSVRAEVYAPTLACIAVMLTCAERFDADHRAAGRWLCLAGLVAGLGMGLHNATVASVMPALFLFVVTIAVRDRVPLRWWAYATICLAIGLSVTAYLPIRAAQNPPLNWGWLAIDPAPRWAGVVGHDSWITMMTGSLSGWTDRMRQCLILLYDQWGLGLLIFVALGFIAFLSRVRRWAMLLLGAAIGNVAVTALLATEFSDTNADVHGYLLPSLAVMGLFVAAGFVQALSLLRAVAQRLPTARMRPILVGTSSALVGFLALAPVVINAPFCNLVSHRLAYVFGAESTLHLKPNAVVILKGANWDFVLRGLQYCDEWRPDVRVINRDLLPSAWYRQWAKDRYPGLGIERIPADDDGLELDRWAQELAAEGVPVYWEFTEIDLEMVNHLLPAGHLFEVTGEPTTLEPSSVEHQEEFERNSLFYGDIERIRFDYDAQMVYVAGLYRAGIYYEARGYYDRARELIRRALSFNSSSSEPDGSRQRLPSGLWLGLRTSRPGPWLDRAAVDDPPSAP